MKGFIIKPYWGNLIFDGIKNWEIRGTKTNIRGTVGIILSGTGMVYGTVDIIDCIEVTMDELKANKHNHQIDDLSIVKYKKIYAWVLSNPRLYDKPVPYVHKKGAIIWVNI